VAALREAVALYRGDFLAGFYIRDASAFEEWAVGERQYLRGLVVDALHRLAAAYSRRGDYAEAISVTRRSRLSARPASARPGRQAAAAGPSRAA
jgi:two-component SAPR family response regulator